MRELFRRNAKGILRLAKIFYTTITFFFIMYFSWTNKELLEKMIKSADISFLFFSLSTWCILHLLSPFSPKVVFAGLGYQMPYKHLLFIHLSRLPARYLPGGIWHTVGRLKDYHSYGIPRNQLAIFTLIETLFPCIITFFLGGSYLCLASEHNSIYNIPCILAIISSCILVITPYWALKKLRNYLTSNFHFIYLLLALLSISFWVIASISFVFYYLSMVEYISSISLTKIAATYIFSWGVGYVSIFAPQGIGIFELVAGKMMEIPLTLGGAISFLAGFRIVAFGADCLTLLIYYGFLRAQKI